MEELIRREATAANLALRASFPERSNELLPWPHSRAHAPRRIAPVFTVAVLGDGYECPERGRKKIEVSSRVAMSKQQLFGRKAPPLRRVAAKRHRCWFSHGATLGRAIPLTEGGAP